MSYICRVYVRENSIAIDDTCLMCDVYDGMAEMCRDLDSVVSVPVPTGIDNLKRAAALHLNSVHRITTS
jgi:hypothetical protein